jgi:hypothetical protein
MASEIVSLRAKMSRFTGTRRVGLSSSGFGLIDALLGLVISATLIAPVLGGVLIVLKTAPGSASDSVISGQQATISGQQATNRQNFELNLTSAQMRNDWSDATIVKTPAAFYDYRGLDCEGAGLGSLSGNPATQLLFSLQVRSRADLDLETAKLSNGTAADLRGKILGFDKVTGATQGLTRVVYSLLPEGNGLKSLVRRECAVEKVDGIPLKNDGTQYVGPRVKSGSNLEGRNDVGTITSDYRGWRLQPGFIKPSGKPELYASTANWSPQEPKKVLNSVSDVKLVSPPCNDRIELPDAELVDVPDLQLPTNKTEEQLLALYPYYTRCDVELKVEFPDDREDYTVRLYQGFGY